jgi:hypothetical protein
VIAYAHGCKTLRDCLAVSSVTIPDHVPWWCFIPREGIGDLTGDPLRRRMRRYAQGFQPSPLVNEKQAKANRRHDQAAVSKLESTDNRVRTFELFGADSRSTQVAAYLQVGLDRSP